LDEGPEYWKPRLNSTKRKKKYVFNIFVRFERNRGQMYKHLTFFADYQ
jgi:hypothetical protein